MTARDLCRGPRSYRGDGAAETALQSLVKAGCGRWAIDDHLAGPGQPARVFILTRSDAGDGDTK